MMGSSSSRTFTGHLSFSHLRRLDIIFFKLQVLHECIFVVKDPNSREVYRVNNGPPSSALPPFPSLRLPHWFCGHPSSIFIHSYLDRFICRSFEGQSH